MKQVSWSIHVLFDTSWWFWNEFYTIRSPV